MSVSLPVSIGEALDKLSILDIKLARISDDTRKAHVHKEYTALYEILAQYVKKFQFHYKILYQLNDDMWILQDDIRKEFNVEKCIETIDKNDARFRVKNNINKMANSEFQEQKGYPTKNAVFIGHLGLGDHLCLSGAVRYLSLDWDAIYVLCKPKNLKNVERLYEDAPNIQCVPVKNDFQFPELDGIKFSKIFKSGLYCENPREFTNLPNGFYKDLGLDPEIQNKYFWVSPPKFSIEISIPYIFVHQETSSKTISLVNWDINERLTIDPNTNLYSQDHVWHRLAGACVGHLVPDYSELLVRAQEVHLMDSCFYCLARYLPLQASVKICYERESGNPSEIYKF